MYAFLTVILTISMPSNAADDDHLFSILTKAFTPSNTSAGASTFTSFKGPFSSVFISTAFQSETNINVTLPLSNTTIEGVQTDGVDIFYGIPYAQPPVGELR